jgi:hypothetical protein
MAVCGVNKTNACTGGTCAGEAQKVLGLLGSDRGADRGQSPQQVKNTAAGTALAAAFGFPAAAAGVITGIINLVTSAG